MNSKSQIRRLHVKCLQEFLQGWTRVGLKIHGHVYTFRLVFCNSHYLLPLSSRFDDHGPAVAVITNRDRELGHHHACEEGFGSLCDDTSDSLHHLKVHLQPLVRVIRLRKKENSKKKGKVTYCAITLEPFVLSIHSPFTSKKCDKSLCIKINSSSFYKILWYKRNNTLQVVLLYENN